MFFIKTSQKLYDFPVFFLENYAVIFSDDRSHFGCPVVWVFEKTFIVSCRHYKVCHGSPADYVLCPGRQINHRREIH